jgi:hypothetical protein
MDMTVILLVCLVLACLPLMMAGFFRVFTLPGKLRVVKQDVSRMTRDLSPGTQAESGISPSALSTQIEALADRYFSRFTLFLPALLLTFFYVAGFALCDAYLAVHFHKPPIDFGEFPREFVDAARPALYTFVGVYLFNLGAMVRRLYLADVNEQVFWGGVNRLLLSMGLSLVVMKAGLEKFEGFVYFSIGFIANIFLEWVLENTLKVLNMNKPKQDDLPLQMVRGIDIWKEYRLEEESIDNVQNLATADVLELAVRTHYGVRTLIDWIDQALILTRLTTDQVKILASQAMALSAIELATAAPENNKGDQTFSNALADKLKVDPVLMAATLNRLFEDEQVRSLWALWQSGMDAPAQVTVRFPLQAPPAVSKPDPDQGLGGTPKPPQP